MAPVKFDDLAKTANEVLNDDYKTSGYEFKAKQKTTFDGAIITTAVELFPTKDSCMTPAKLTWKLPAPGGCPFFVVDKLEVDKSGGVKMDMSTDKAVKGLKLECKSDLSDINKLLATCTYTGIKDTQLKLDTKVMSPDQLTCEVSRAQGPATIGVKAAMATLTTPDVGVRFVHGPMFGALVVKGLQLESPQDIAWTPSCHYKVSDQLRCAAALTLGGMQNGDCTCGLAYEVQKGTVFKAVFRGALYDGLEPELQTPSLSCSLKHGLSKGFTLLGGLKYDISKGSYGYGLQVSIE